MYELDIRIEPEPELFHYYESKDSFQGYCTGDNALVIYRYDDQSNEGSFIRNDTFLIDSEIKTQTLDENTSLYQFNCTCVLNPPSKIRKMIKEVDGVILNPILIENNWEYVSIVIKEYSNVSKLIEKLNNYFRLEVLKINKLNLIESITLSKVIKNLNLTNRQMNTIIEAWKQGYYSIPRRIKTEELAANQKITRYALEKKLRVAENKIMEKLIPYLLLLNKKEERKIN